jgi:hypothetical protein
MYQAEADAAAALIPRAMADETSRGCKSTRGAWLGNHEAIPRNFSQIAISVHAVAG